MPPLLRKKNQVQIEALALGSKHFAVEEYLTLVWIRIAIGIAVSSIVKATSHRTTISVSTSSSSFAADGIAQEFHVRRALTHVVLITSLTYCEPSKVHVFGKEVLEPSSFCA